MSVPSVNTNKLKRKKCKCICSEVIKVHQKKEKISVNLNVLKELHRNHKEETDIKLKVEEM